MRNLSILVLVVLSWGVGFWLGQAHAKRRDGSAARPAISRNVNVAVGGDPGAGNVVLSNGLTVDGDLQMRALPSGKLVLQGNLNVRPN